MTDTNSTPVAPGAPLGPSGRHLWAEVAEGYDLDPLEAANLAAAARQLDVVPPRRSPAASIPASRNDDAHDQVVRSTQVATSTPSQHLASGLSWPLTCGSGAVVVRGWPANLLMPGHGWSS